MVLLTLIVLKIAGIPASAEEVGTLNVLDKAVAFSRSAEHNWKAKGVSNMGEFHAVCPRALPQSMAACRRRQLVATTSFIHISGFVNLVNLHNPHSGKIIQQKP